MRKLSKKGLLDMGDIMWLGLSIISVFVAVTIFIPFANILANTTENMPNAGVFMSVIWIIPVVLAAGVLWAFFQKAQSREV